MQNVLRLRYFLCKNPVKFLQQTLEISCFFFSFLKKNAHFHFRKLGFREIPQAVKLEPNFVVYSTASLSLKKLKTKSNTHTKIKERCIVCNVLLYFQQYKLNILKNKNGSI